ncbi:MAG: flavodoxin family protein [Sporomusaceae bacterium]|jgi:multimeric flavodoxin WrbA|nr:flavodoxin family protein [Sporomusaceae bacterium]
MAKKITLLTGSPRRGGNTDLLTDAFVKGALESGNEVFRFDTAALNIAACLDCKYCFQHAGECEQKDDMQEIYTALRQSEVLVLASPIYFFDFSAQLKLAIDRMYNSVGRPYPIKECALLLVCADNDASVADGAINTYQAIYSYLNWQNLGIVLQTGVSDKGEITGKDALVKAKKLGESIR